MQKNLFLLSFILLFLSIHTSHAQVDVEVDSGVNPSEIQDYQSTISIPEANIFVSELKTNKTTYSPGETITFSVSVDNSANILQSDLYLETTFELIVDGASVDIDPVVQDSDYFVAKNSRRTEMYTRTVTDSVSGNVNLVAAVYLGDGSLFGYKKVPITIRGITNKEIAILTDAYLQIGAEEFDLQVGPTVDKEQDLKLIIETPSLNKEYIIKPVLNLYNRTKQSPVLQTIELDEITLKSNTQYSFNLPIDLEPLVYEAEITFPSKQVYLAPIYARYVIDGPIATIINTTTDIVSGKKGETINVLVQYAGTPTPINQEEGYTTDNKADLEVFLIDENNSIVGSNKVQISLAESGAQSIPVTLSSDVEKMKIKSTISLGQDILDEYETVLPSETELTDIQHAKSSKNKYLLIIIGLIVLSIVSFVFVKLKHKKELLVSLVMIVCAGGIAGGLYVYKSDAQVGLYYNPSANRADYFRINSIISPAPATSYVYAPGEEFNLEMSANFVSCNNTGHTYSVYAPSTNWDTFDFDLTEFTSIFDYWDKKDITNTFGRTGDNWGKKNNTRIADWWISVGDIGDVAINGSTAGFADRNITGKESILVWATRDKGEDQVRLGNERSYRYTIDTNYTWNMPEEPGYHKFYFFMRNDGNGNTASAKIVSQTVCVSGAGLCPNENQPICTNLIGNFTQNPTGQIYQDGVLTNYTMDQNGVCTETIVCAEGFELNAENICVSVTNFNVFCSASPSSLVIPEGSSTTDPVTFEVSSISGGVGPYTYSWERNYSEVSTSNSYTINSISSAGPRTFTAPVSLTVTDSTSATASDTCSVLVTDNNVSDVGGGGGGGGGGDPTINVSTFNFTPSIADDGGKCSLTLQATGVDSCEIRGRLDEVTVPATQIPVIGGVIDIVAQRIIPVGTHTLFCRSIPEGVYIQVPNLLSRSCSTNPSISEN